MQYIFVTGVSSGIGYDTTRYFIQQGYTVLASVRKQADKERLEQKFPNNLHCFLFDVTDRDAIRIAAIEVQSILGDNLLTALVNNAGIAVAGPMQLVDDDRFEEQMRINLIGTRNVTNAFLPMLGARLDRQADQQPGKIINISSISGILNTPINGSYCVAKHAMESLGEVYRRELFMYGIDVVSIQPGPIQSEIWSKNAESMTEFADSDYAPMIRQVNEIMKQAQRDALPAEVISKLIHKIIKTRRPKTQYIVHSRRWPVTVIAKWMPARWVDRMLYRKLTNASRERGTNDA